LPTWAQKEVTDEPWGELQDGTRITRYTMTNAGGARASFMALGAAILSVEVPDRNGTLADVVLGFDTAEEYRSGNSAYFGLTIGRYASRIAGTTITRAHWDIRQPRETSRSFREPTRDAPKAAPDRTRSERVPDRTTSPRSERAGFGGDVISFPASSESFLEPPGALSPIL